MGQMLISQHQSASWSRDRSHWQNYGTGFRATELVPKLWCQYLSTRVRHSHRTSLGSTATVSETQNGTWNAPEQTRIRHCNKNMQSVSGLVTVTGPGLETWDRTRKNGTKHGMLQNVPEPDRNMQPASGIVTESVTVTGPVTKMWDRSRKHGISLGNTGSVSETWNWSHKPGTGHGHENAPEQMRTRQPDTGTGTCN